MFTSLTSAHGDGRGRHPPEVASVLNEKLAELSDLVRDASSTFSGRPSSTLDLAKRGTGLAPATGVEPRVRFVKCLEFAVPCSYRQRRLSDCNDKYHINQSL
jgi:hypothetical protein